MRVIIATDGSIEADIAEVVLKRLQVPQNAEFTVAMVTHLPAHAVAGIATASLGVGQRVAADTWRFERDVARQTTDHVADRLRSEGFKAESLVLEGNTADALLTLIRERRGDAVALGCGGRSDLAAALLGSVSRKMVLYSEASVLVGKRFAELASEDTYRTLKSKEMLDVLVAVDGSKGSDLALESLERMPAPAFRHAYVLSVTPSLYMNAAIDLAMMPTFVDDREQVQAIAGEAAARISHCATSVEPITAFGRPSSEICRVASEKGVDLVMLGASRHGALERLIVGSCAYETATEAPCSVLILRDVLLMGGSK